jgi:hypothetical protein
MAGSAIIWLDEHNRIAESSTADVIFGDSTIHRCGSRGQPICVESRLLRVSLPYALTGPRARRISSADQPGLLARQSWIWFCRFWKKLLTWFACSETFLTSLE